MDVESYVETLKEFGANVCMVGCGGITAFHPTRLEMSENQPYLKDDSLETFCAGAMKRHPGDSQV